MSAGVPMLRLNIDRRELLMTAPHARESEILPRPACTPAAIRAVLPKLPWLGSLREGPSHG
jgi:hypothetical protein